MNLMQGKGDNIIREVRDTSGRSEITSAGDELRKIPNKLSRHSWRVKDGIQFCLPQTRVFGMPDKIEEIYVPLSKINELPEVPYQNVKELGNAIETTYVPDVNAILFIRWDFNYEGTSGFDNLAYGPSRLLDPNLERLREELRDTIDEILGNFDVIETKPTIGHNNPPEPIAEEVALVTDLSVIKKEISDALPDTDKATAYRVVISKYVSLFTEKLTAGIADSLAKATVAGVLLLLAKLSGLFDVLMQFLQQR